MPASAISDVPTATPVRSRWIMLAIVLQALWALVLICISIYLLIHTPRSPEHALTLRITGVMFGIPGLIAAAGWEGLRKRKAWGWWLSLVLDALIAAVFIYAVIDDARFGLVDGTLIAAAALASIVPLCLLFPRVRKFYLSGDESA